MRNILVIAVVLSFVLGSLALAQDKATPEEVIAKVRAAAQDFVDDG